MIRINLYAGVKTEPGLADTVRQGLVFAAVGLSAVFVIGLVVLIIRATGSADSKPQPVSTPTTAVAAPAPQPVKVAYASMPLAQRLAYEITFARQALDALSAAFTPELGVPAEITVDSFSVVRLKGKSSSKESVAKLLAGLRSDDITLLPRPHTQVGSVGGAFEYAAAAQLLFFPDNATFRPESVLARMPSMTVQAAEVKRFEQFAADARVEIRKGLRYTSTQKAGRLRRLVYKFDAVSTYDDFVRFVRNVHAAHISCAFGPIRMTSGGAARMNVSAELYFTAQE